ncbi:hypothetical protein [Pedobacter punctiformis]|uniref:DUF4595 domain-containing protein n=1 Tax=Pedobacter punctiformis TaxID=3004097 RepID=A0ABT4LDE6_9SPHI|nr:hypothetical protein [Pedobacter sp. HCMS5-2]MCZ4245193.1 hypothetical protein [Pedobacter sp. HCMS5-2]
MNKRLNIFLLTVCALVLIFVISCKKTADTDPVIDQSCRASNIEDYTETTLNNAYSLTYDDYRRLIQRAGKTNTFNVVYGTDKVTVTGTNGGSLDITLKDGRAIKTAAVGTTNYEEYTYNTSGYISEVKYYEAGTLKSTYTLSYSGGNLTQIGRTDVGFIKDQTNTTTITYTTTPTNFNLQFMEPFNTMVSNFNAPYRIYGNMSIGIVTKVVNDQSVKSGAILNQTVTTNDYLYLKDSVSNYNIITNKKNIKTLTDNTIVTDVTTNLKYNIGYSCKN